MDRINLQKHLQALASSINSNYIVTIQEIKQDKSTVKIKQSVTLDDSIELMLTACTNISKYERKHLNKKPNRDEDLRILQYILTWHLRHRLDLTYKRIGIIMGNIDHATVMARKRKADIKIAEGSPMAIDLHYRLEKEYNRLLDLKKQELKSE